VDGRWEWTPCYSLYTWAPQTLGLVDILAFKTCWCLAGINSFFNQISLYFSCCFFKTVTMKTQFQPHSWSVNNCRLNNSGNVAESQGTAWWVPSWNRRWQKSKRWTSCQSSFLVTIMSCTSLLLPLFSSGKLFYNCFPQMVIEGIYILL